jgi:uncharacterized iron-regulated protein
VGYSSQLAPNAATHADPPDRPEAKPVAPDVVEKSALPFQSLRVTGQSWLSQQEFFDELAAQDVVCMAEHHDNPHHHWAQLYVIQELAKRSAISGRELGLGLEMFQTPFQPELDRYASDKLDVAELLEQTQYEKRWGYPFAFYAPQIDHAVARGAALVALNTPREQTKRVARGGFDALTDRERRLLGGYDLKHTQHRARFEALMQNHPKHRGSMEHLYAAQVLWDEGMAQAASDWLSARFPARQLVILAGSAHCHRSAIPDRIKRRIRAKVVGVNPVISTSASVDLAKLEQGLAGFDYGFVMTAP